MEYITINENKIDINVTELDLSLKQLTEIPEEIKELKKLTKINLELNQITEINNLPEGLEDLRLSKNDIKIIDNLPSTLKYLDLSYNQIQEINNLPNQLKCLKINFNKIIEIKNLPLTLEQLELENNFINEIPIEILHLKQLRSFSCVDNPINYIPCNINKWINENDNNKSIHIDNYFKNLNIKKSFCNYVQVTVNHPLINSFKNSNNLDIENINIYHSNIQKSFCRSLQNIIKDKFLLNNNFIKNDLMSNQILHNLTKVHILYYLDRNKEHSIYKITYQELFQFVYTRIYLHDNKDLLFHILNQEIEESINMCFTGKLTRLLKVLNGFYDDINIEMKKINKKIIDSIICLRWRYKIDNEEGVNNVLEELKKYLIDELKDYDDETIKEWIRYF